MKYRYKISLIFAAMIILVALYYIFKINIYLWSCENESISSSCYIVGLIHHEENEMDQAYSFYDKSCQMDYALGCDAVAKILTEKGETQQAALLKARACKLNLKRACP
jgi:TPR repeat protein